MHLCILQSRQKTSDLKASRLILSLLSCYRTAAGICGLCVKFCQRGDPDVSPRSLCEGSAALRNHLPSGARLSCGVSFSDGGSLSAPNAGWECCTECPDRTEPALINPPNLEEKHQRMNVWMQHSTCNYTVKLCNSVWMCVRFTVPFSASCSQVAHTLSCHLDPCSSSWSAAQALWGMHAACFSAMSANHPSAQSSHTVSLCGVPAKTQMTQSDNPPSDWITVCHSSLTKGNKQHLFDNRHWFSFNHNDHK